MPGMVDRTVRWGILATGGIAAKFTEDLALVADAEVVAVGSRTAAAAQTFAQRYGIPRAYGSWAQLAEDPEVDVVYVATPHSAHHAAALTCIEAGKAVLVEKPLTLDVPTAEALVAAARARGTFLMEAMWMRCLPGIRRLAELVAEGAIGEVTTVLADFGLPGPYPATHRLRDRALGGGALLDLGIYPVSLAHLLLGSPSTVLATARLTPEGVDQNTAVVLAYPGAAQAVLSCGFVGGTPCGASVTGTRGRIDLPERFHRPQRLRVHRPEGTEVVEAPIEGWGYHFEAVEVGRCLRAGLGESPLVPLDSSVAVLSILDAVREQIGVHYPAGRA
jgi:predicted dehydrogenase